ncbi:MAG: hypothetical protein LQ340_007602 [Diploschistes diacapsis]|nr:MAG: hypothetical protein LQ340_007602 [Diploschistes diacapsis]
MLIERSMKPLCSGCRRALYALFNVGFASPNAISVGRLPRSPGHVGQPLRAFSTVQPLKFADPATSDSIEQQCSADATPYEDLEAAVRHARNTFGATLPANYLSAEEYKIYERLYGPPVAETSAEDAELLEDIEESAVEEEEEKGPTLYRERGDGELEEVDNIPEVEEEGDLLAEDLIPSKRLDSETDEEYAARMMLLRDMDAAASSEGEEGYINDDGQEYTLADIEPDLSEEERARDESNNRSHPYTEAGRFATFPSSILLPKNTFVEPISGILSMVSNKQLAECTKKTFGGEILPDSVATPSGRGRHLQQKPIALEASQSRMGPMEASSFIAANMPGAYASVMATLVETRRRLGSEWLEGLLRREGGPRVLDAGAGGAGILAWHEVLRAEWTRLYPEESPKNPVPLGKATVIAGSSELRQRIKLLLENTTFLPRMQDFVSTRDLPGSQTHNPELRKQYDLIIAPHTLWTLKEDYMRKAQVQNYFTLLNPNGGVLIIIEKGVPRGFELVAGAREVLLNHHIASPGSAVVENEIQAASPGRFIKKEPGMIIAPCTNHGTCPMYMESGQMSGRKDHCHFSQRFVRPPFLQRIHGPKHSNHEDIQFSYVSVRRGIDERTTTLTPQNEESTLAALRGYEDDDAVPNPMTLPRLLAPAIKRHKHVTFDLCTPAANLERWTVPKSFSNQGYRDARKARWGDLWALGAKTRVVRSSRSGSARPRPKTRTIEIRVGAREEDDTIRDLAEELRGRKDETGRKRTKKPRKLREKDLE